MLGWPGSSPRRKRPSGSITICPLSTASSILPIFTSDLDRRAVPGLLDVGYGHHAKSAGLMPEGPLRSTRKRRERRRRVWFQRTSTDRLWSRFGPELPHSCPCPQARRSVVQILPSEASARRSKKGRALVVLRLLRLWPLLLLTLY